jgi:hypothetical protein
METCYTNIEHVNIKILRKQNHHWNISVVIRDCAHMFLTGINFFGKKRNGGSWWIMWSSSNHENRWECE